MDGAGRKLAWESGHEIPFLPTEYSTSGFLASSASREVQREISEWSIWVWIHQIWQLGRPHIFLWQRLRKCPPDRNLAVGWTPLGQTVIQRPQTTKSQFQVLVMPLEHVQTPWTSVSSSIKWSYEETLTGFLWRKHSINVLTLLCPLLVRMALPSYMPRSI